MPGAIIFPPFLRLRVDGRKRFEYATCGRKYFQKRRKKLRSQKYPHTCGRGLILDETVRIQRLLDLLNVTSH